MLHNDPDQLAMLGEQYLNMLGDDASHTIADLFEETLATYESNCAMIHKEIRKMAKWVPPLQPFENLGPAPVLNIFDRRMLILSYVMNKVKENWAKYLAYDKQRNNAELKIIESVLYSDYVKIDEELLKHLQTFWVPKDWDPTCIPYDILLTGLPLQNIIIEPDNAVNVGENFHYYEISIHNDASFQIERAYADTKKRKVVVGNITIIGPHTKILVSKRIIFNPILDSLTTERRSFFNDYEDVPNYCLINSFSKEIALDILKSWYGIQISLLNPLIKEVYQEKREKTLLTHRIATDSKFRKIRYIRRVVLNKDELEPKKKDETTGRVIKCPLWYVIGHYRTYRTGTPEEYKVFVKGFWKGKMRNKISEQSKIILRERLMK